jgi:hypothetical protein
VSGLVWVWVPVMVLVTVLVWVSELVWVWVWVSVLVWVLVATGWVWVVPKAHRSPRLAVAGWRTLVEPVPLVVWVVRRAGPQEGLALQSLQVGIEISSGACRGVCVTVTEDGDIVTPHYHQGMR